MEMTTKYLLIFALSFAMASACRISVAKPPPPVEFDITADLGITDMADLVSSLVFQLRVALSSLTDLVIPIAGVDVDLSGKLQLFLTKLVYFFNMATISSVDSLKDFAISATVILQTIAAFVADSVVAGAGISIEAANGGLLSVCSALTDIIDAIPKGGFLFGKK